MSDLQKLSAAEAAAEDVRCSFCGKPPVDDGALIAGSDAWICDECIARSSDILTDAVGGEREEPPGAADENAEPSGGASPSKRVSFRLLTEAEVVSLLSMDNLLDAMEDALRRFSVGEVVQPVRTVVPVSATEAVFLLMPALVRNPDVLGAKLVTLFAGNAAFDLPTHLATILLLSPETGALIGIMDGRYITEVRTAAVSAISASRLARDESAVMAIIGSGVQARSHLQALDRVFELEAVRIWSPTPDHQAMFLEEMAPATTARLVGTDSAEQAVHGADIIVLATSASTPVVQDEWVKDGAHVISVGACRPNQREMDPTLVQRGRLFVDSRAAALVESGDIVLGIQEQHFDRSHILGELGEVVAGRVQGRQSPRDVTIFKSLGLAVEDVVAADLVYRRAMERGIGTELEF